jgi:hypothetical protein
MRTSAVSIPSADVPDINPRTSMAFDDFDGGAGRLMKAAS